MRKRPFFSQRRTWVQFPRKIGREKSGGKRLGSTSLVGSALLSCHTATKRRFTLFLRSGSKVNFLNQLKRPTFAFPIF